jgi:hypothetical protein
MIRHAVIPLAFVVVALGLGGCATTRNVAGEPSPKEDGAPAVDAAPSDTPAESTATAPAAPPPSAPAAAAFIPTGKPQIIARFEKVQFPAWVERAGVRAGIKAGWAVYTSDRIITGPEGRVELSTAGDGSLKIGGDSEVQMTQAYEFTGSAVEPSLFKIKRGSYTFTAPLVRSASATSGTVVEIGDEINANVFGGQITGRVDGTESVMGIVDAIVRVSGAKLNPGTMREPNTFLRVPRVGKANPVTGAPSTTMARWLSAAQMVSGRPTLSGNSDWDVSLNSGYNQRQLEDMACRINRRGIPTEIYPVKEPGKLTWYRVVVRRFASKNDAVNFLNTAKSLGSREPWVLVPQS